MFSIEKLLTSWDSYNLRARISVGILFLAPLLLELYLLVPELHDLSSTVIVVIIAYGIANIIIIYSRLLGNNAKKKCFPKHFPAQQALLPSSTYIDSKTKQRYYDFFLAHVSGFELSNSDTEMSSSVSTAVNWLISQTRDASKFPLIAEENINFGFSYNLLGLKPYGIMVSLLCMLFNSILFYLHYKELINVSLEALLAGFIISLLFLLLWLFIITQNLVKSCGRKYARALLSACDSPHLN